MRRENQQKTELLALSKKEPSGTDHVLPESPLVEQQAFEYEVREDQLRQKASLLLGSFEGA